MDPETATAGEVIDFFLSEHCTGQDDHDVSNCRKCAEMKTQLLKLFTACPYCGHIPGSSYCEPHRLELRHTHP